MANSVVELPNVGNIIYYKLRRCDSPIKPDKIWHGKAIRVSIDQPRAIDHIQVESLESGYEGLTELVMFSQVVGVVTQEDRTLGYKAP